MIIVTVNGLTPEQYRQKQQKPMTEEQHQKRVVASVNRIIAHNIRNHSGARTSRGRVIYSQEAVNG